ncbi:MAG: hypothetical protein QXI58_03900 [Candidatus Micrarchaeia archaeon]
MVTIRDSSVKGNGVGNEWKEKSIEKNIEDIKKKGKIEEIYKVKKNVNEVIKEIFEVYSLPYCEREEKIKEIKGKINGDWELHEGIIKELVKNYINSDFVGRGKILFILNNFFSLDPSLISDFIDRMNNKNFHITEEEKEKILVK